MGTTETRFQILDNLPPVSVDAVVHQVKACHARPEDFDDGNLVDRLYCYRAYSKGIIDIRVLDLQKFDICEQTVQEYKVAYLAHGPGPELVYDPVNNSLIDGNHRANAAFELGVYFMEAFIGHTDTYEPLIDPDDKLEVDEDHELDDDDCCSPDWQ
jgi:hypothetical protein